MFCHSTQKKHWIFDDTLALEECRAKANQDAAKELLKDGKSPEFFLTPQEESWLVKSFLDKLRSFCGKFEPPMPKSVIATAFMYMKRFYLNESCMKYQPRDIGITCAYLAAKVDEFNLTIDQFVKKTEGDCRKAQETILSNELLLMKKLRFHLTVHLPYRAKEGFFIDIRARYPQARDKTKILDPEAEEYLERVMYTDACFLFTPSQIALAAIYTAAIKKTIDLESYLSEIIFAENPKSLTFFKSIVETINKLLEETSQNSLTKEQMKIVTKKMKEIKDG